MSEWNIKTIKIRTVIMAVFGNVFSPSISLKGLDNEGCDLSLYDSSGIERKGKMKGKKCKFWLLCSTGFFLTGLIWVSSLCGYLDVLTDDTDR